MIWASITASTALFQTPTGLEVLLHDWGWTGVFIYILFKEVIPWVRSRIDKSADTDAELKRKQADSEAALKEAQAAREAAREERMVKAMEDMAETTSGIRTILASVNVRLEVIERQLGLPTPEADEPKTQPRKR